MILAKIAILVIILTLIYAFIWRIACKVFLNSLTPREQLDYAYFRNNPTWLDVLTYILIALILLSICAVIYLTIYWLF